MLDFPMKADIDGILEKLSQLVMKQQTQSIKKHGIFMPIIVCADRTQPIEQCIKYVKGFEPYLSMIDGLGLDYEEAVQLVPGRISGWKR